MNFADSPGSLSADEVRLAEAFGGALARLQAAAPGGAPDDDARLRDLGREVWLAAAGGHSCVDLDAGRLANLPGLPALSRKPSQQIAPLVLDGAQLYLARLWQAETGLAKHLAGFDQPQPVADAATIEPVLGALFGARDDQEPQQQAVLTALTRRLCLITGGPGTGKTHTLASLLVAFARLKPGLRVAYAAPTGKAAARLAQALADSVARLDASGQIAAILPRSGLTVHRLVNRRPTDLPLSAFDLVIVDEASMLDLELAHRLAAALGPQTRLVLAGDRDQLASVEPGAVFAALCEARLQGRIRLVRNWRQREAPGIAALAAAIRDGLALPLSGDSPDIRLEAAEPARVLSEALRGFEPAWRLVQDCPAADEADAIRICQAFDAFRVLCALRDGPLGAQSLNAALHRHYAGAAGRDWYPGRLLIVTRNEPARGLVNGDVGVCLPWAARGGALAVAFVAGGKVRWVPVGQMPRAEDAWAITIHKSQGSEFSAVLLVPAPAGHPLNARELIYTGVTRARHRLQIHASLEALRQAAGRPADRQGRLRIRIDAELAP